MSTWRQLGKSALLCFSILQKQNSENMEVITFDSRAYKKLEAKINTILAYVTTHPNEQTENEENKEKLFDSKEVAKILQVSTRTVLRMRMKGEISFVRIGGRVRFRQADFNDYIENRKILTREQN